MTAKIRLAKAFIYGIIEADLLQRTVFHVWTCKSCLMENEDKDTLCYMCGTKRPHTAAVRQKNDFVAPAQQTTASVPSADADNEKNLTVCEPQQAQPFVFHWNEDATQESNSEQTEMPQPTEEKTAEMQSDAVPQEPKTADVNLFASVFNVPAPQELPQELPSEPPAQPPVQQTSFADAFNDFLSAIQQIEPQNDHEVSGDAEKPVVTHCPEEPPHEEHGSRFAKKQQRAQNRKAVAGRVVAFLRVLSTISLCLWLFCLCIFLFAFFAENEAYFVRFNAEELFYALANRISDVPFFTWPELVEHFLSVISTL